MPSTCPHTTTCLYLSSLLLPSTTCLFPHPPPAGHKAASRTAGKSTHS
ncbi:hypothetical protein E2C01_038902 [Portunus trituberculatus]|uniref:Uncharacterized protein n=1 Tax=Portunus trituberculatus TaxID=210409 RepID=A0A5B7FC63_PORTR|nr:hypothetical protein [Portunus trituberculatus]